MRKIYYAYHDDLIYYDFGSDVKYLEDVIIKVVKKIKYKNRKNIICEAYYNPKEKTIYIQESSFGDPNVISHEESHAIVDGKFGIYKDIERCLPEKFKETCKEAREDLTKEMKNEINKAIRIASRKAKKLYSSDKAMEFIENNTQTEFEKECLIDLYCHKELFDTLNVLSERVAEKIGEKYGHEAEEFTKEFFKTKGANELLARAVGKQVLGKSAIGYSGYYFFDGSGTIYKLSKMLKEKGYPYVSDKLFSQRVKRVKKLLSKLWL